MKDLNIFTMNMSYLQKVAMGYVPGARVVKIPGRHDADVNTSQLGDMSPIPSVVTIPRPAGENLELVSSSANDSSGGGGMESICVRYLDSAGVEQETNFVLTGLTPVLVGTSMHDIQWMHAGEVGSSGDVAAGNISLRDVTTGAIIYEYIVAGGNQSLSCRYKIPVAKSAYIVEWNGSGLKRRIDFYLRADVDRITRELTTNAFLFQDYVRCEANVSGNLPANYLKLPALSTVKVSAQADLSTGEAGCSVTLLVIDDDAGE